MEGETEGTLADRGTEFTVDLSCSDHFNLEGKQWYESA